MDKSQFKFHTQVRVRNYEIDWQGIVHNANYLLYFEVGRVEYLKHLGVPVSVDSITSESHVVLVRNEIDYKSSARFDDLLNVYTRVSFVKNTSFGFEGILENAETGRLVGENVAIHVWLDPVHGEPTPVNARFRDAVIAYEGEAVSILHKSRDKMGPRQP